MKTNNIIEKIIRSIPNLTVFQLERIDSIVSILLMDFLRIAKNLNSDIATEEFVRDFGDVLRIHHAFSNEPFSKDKFEFALEKILYNLGRHAVLAQKGNPGYDIKIDSQTFSLKTQADKQLKEDSIHISKFMELGKGKWENSIEDLSGLRDQFLFHMKNYDRILILRCLSKDLKNLTYELVEIPKKLLLEAGSGSLKFSSKSRQAIARPGTCDILSSTGEMKFQLYFDGGGERKLQVKNLQKKYCTVHATWAFSSIGVV